MSLSTALSVGRRPDGVSAAVDGVQQLVVER